MSAKWLLNLSFRAEKVGLVLASASNSLLLFMLIFKANTSYGAYKHLMICYTIIEMIYSFLSFLTGMAAHSTESAYVVFQTYSGYLDRSIAPLFLIDFCGIYFVLLLILVVHFVYRYFVVCHFKLLQLFEGFYLVFWIVIPIVFGFSNAIVKFFVFGENEYLTEQLRPIFLTNYNLTMDQVIYNGPNYYVCPGFGECEKPVIVWVAMIWITCTLITCALIMSYCGSCAYVKLSQPNPHASIRTSELQKQLMTALIIQSLIPMVFMYVPIILLFTSPMFGISFGPYVNITMASLAIYPPVDQFAIIYVIRDFRMAFKNIFCRGKESISAQSSAVFVSKASY